MANQPNQWINYDLFKLYEELQNMQEADYFYRETGWIGEPIDKQRQEVLLQEIKDKQNATDTNAEISKGIL